MPGKRLRSVHEADAAQLISCGLASSHWLGDEEIPMKIKRVLLMAGGGLSAVLLQLASTRLHAEAQAPLALSGQVTSAEEGPMEGVVVSAKKDGSTISISVVTDAAGPFCFPGREARTRSLRIKSAGGGLSIWMRRLLPRRSRMSPRARKPRLRSSSRKRRTSPPISPTPNG